MGFPMVKRNSLRVIKTMMASTRERRAQKTALLEFRSEEIHRALSELTRLALSSTHLEQPLVIAALSLDNSYHHVLAEISEDRRRTDQLQRGVPPPKDEGTL